MGNLGFTEIVIFIAVLIGIFLIMREINIWYFKIDKRIQLQEETNRLLKQLVEKSADKKHFKNSHSQVNEEESDVNNPEALQKIIEDLNSRATK